MEEEKAETEKREKKPIGVVGAGKISGIYRGFPQTSLRASGKPACHVLEVMPSIHDASASGTYYPVQSVGSRPEPLV